MLSSFLLESIHRITHNHLYLLHKRQKTFLQRLIINLSNSYYMEEPTITQQVHMIVDPSEASNAFTTNIKTNNINTLNAKPAESTTSSHSLRPSSTKPPVLKKSAVQIPIEYTIHDLVKATTGITVTPIPANTTISHQHLRNLTTNEALRIGILVSFLPHSELLQLASYLTDEISHCSEYHYLINSLRNYMKTKNMHVSKYHAPPNDVKKTSLHFGKK